MSLIKSNFPGLTDFFDENWFDNKIKDWAPAVNVVDNDKNYEIEVAAPGLKKDDFSVDVENGVLVITGKTEKENEEKKKNYTRKEFSSRSFSKRFTLPENVEEDNIEASYTEGVLHVKLHKLENKAPAKKKISIR